MDFQIRSRSRTPLPSQDYMTSSQTKYASYSKSPRQKSFGSSLFRVPGQKLPNQSIYLFNEQQGIIKKNSIFINEAFSTIGKNGFQFGDCAKYSDFLQKYKERLKRERKKHIKQHSRIQKDKKNYQANSQKIDIVQMMTQKISMSPKKNNLIQLKDTKQSAKVTINSQKGYKSIKQQTLNSQMNHLINLPTLKNQSSKVITQNIISSPKNSQKNFTNKNRVGQFQIKVTSINQKKGDQAHKVKYIQEQILPWKNQFNEDDFLTSEYL